MGPAEADRAVGGIAIRARGLTKRFQSLVAVDHVDLTVPQAAVYGFLGYLQEEVVSALAGW